MKNILLSSLFLFSSFSFAETNQFSQLPSGSTFEILTSIEIPANQTSLRLATTDDTWLCWLFFDVSNKTRMLQKDRIFKISSVNPSGEYFGSATYLATLINPDGKKTSLSVQCMDSTISYLNSLYRGLVRFKPSKPDEFP